MNIEWGTKGKASVLVDGQFGSTGKGLAAAYLSQFIKDLDVATTNAGAQAGHTTVLATGEKFICYHLPTTGVMRKESLVYVNAGSIIDLKSFAAEVEMLIDPKRIVVHPRAVVIEPEDTQAEHASGSATERSASTQKGVGHALTRKIMRKASLAKDFFVADFCGARVEALDLNHLLSLGHSVTVEVPQGFDLSLNHGLSYPYCTSRDCTVGAGLSDAGIHASFLGPTCMVVRTFPIRVGAIYNELQEKLGDSGPFHADSVELGWAKDFPGIEPERTTVTKRVRRIATWSDLQYRAALQMTRPTIVLLNFCNYLRSHVDFTLQIQRMERAHDDLDIHPELIFGFGAATSDVTLSFGKGINWFKNRSF